MILFRILRNCLVWLSCCAGLTFPSLATESHWIEVHSQHFSVVTDVGEKRGREIALRFEQMRSVFGTLLSQPNAILPHSPQIVAFRSAEQMQQFAPLWNGKPTQVAGFFLEQDDRSFIVLDMSADDPWRVVMHEYAHQLLNRSSTRRFDPWFAEGFAGYFSSVEVDRKETRVGEISPRDYEVLLRDSMLPLLDLIRIGQRSRTYNESGDPRSVFYAESTMLVHYLYDNSLLSSVLKYFELKDDKHIPIDAALQQAFGMTAAQLEKALRDYVKLGRYRTYLLPSREEISQERLTVSDLSVTDLSVRLADVHLHSSDYHQRGVEELKQIIQSAPNHAIALRELGFSYLQQQQFSQARECLERAIAANNGDARAHYYSALLISREQGFSNLTDLAAMKKELDVSISLDPESAESRSLLAFVQTFQGDFAAGLESMQTAVRLDPHADIYRFNLAQIYLHNRKADPAIGLLRGIDATGNEYLTRRIAELMEDALAIKVGTAARAVTVPGNLMVTP